MRFKTSLEVTILHIRVIQEMILNEFLGNDLRVKSFALTKLMVGDTVHNFMSCAKLNTQLSLQSENHDSDKKGMFRQQ